MICKYSMFKYFLTVFLIFFLFTAFLSPVIGNSIDKMPIWDGSTVGSFSTGSGSKDDPYVITNADELAYFSDSVRKGETYKNKYIELAYDIVLNDENFEFEPDSGLVRVSDGTNITYFGTSVCGDTSASSTVFDTKASVAGAQYGSVNSSTVNAGTYGGKINKFKPIGTSSSPFCGNFDGKGHTVYGLYINTISDAQGLFGHTENAVISGIKIENSYIKGGALCGAIVGNSQQSDISLCVSSATVCGDGNCGGIAGGLSYGNIFQCHSTSLLGGINNIGGIAGYSLGNIYDCSSLAKLEALSSCGGIAGNASSGSIYRCYFAGSAYAVQAISPITGIGSAKESFCYYLRGSVASYSGGLTETEMKTEKSFSGFDFSTVWTLGSSETRGYPSLLLLKESTHSHEYDNDCDTTCNFCSHVREAQHVYSDTYYYDNNVHFKKCMNCSARDTEFFHVFSNDCDTTCDMCEFKRTASHDVSDKWSYNDKQHFKMCDICGNMIESGAHVWDNDCDTSCNICSKARSVSHKYGNTFISDENGHWYECSECHKINERSEHISSGEATEEQSEICTICGYIMSPALDHIHSYTSEYIPHLNGHTRVCTCGAYEETQSHTWDSGDIIKAPTTDENGILLRSCIQCGAVLEETLSKLPSDSPADTEDDSGDGTQKDHDDTCEKSTNDKGSDNSSSSISLIISIASITISIISLLSNTILIIMIIKIRQKHNE